MAVGARNELHDLYKFLSSSSTGDAANQYLLSKRVTWHHISERAPHFGGLWESAVKSAKHHLRRIVGKRKLTYEEFETISTQVEACLNSRPLTEMASHSPDGVVPLTPGHFLIGRPVQAYPEEPNMTDPYLTKRWELCQVLVQQFWDSWSKDYLLSLQKSRKWHKPQANLSPDDIVMMLDDTSLQTQ